MPPSRLYRYMNEFCIVESWCICIVQCLMRQMALNVSIWNLKLLTRTVSIQVDSPCLLALPLTNLNLFFPLRWCGFDMNFYSCVSKYVICFSQANKWYERSNRFTLIWKIFLTICINTTYRQQHETNSYRGFRSKWIYGLNSPRLFPLSVELYKLQKKVTNIM